MIVYKTFFKIIKKNLPLILMYMGIFIGISFLNTSMGSEDANVTYDDVKVNVAVINNDADGEIAKRMIEYIGTKNTIVEGEWDEQSVKDELFYRTVEYVINIPEGFSEDVLAGKKTVVGKVQVPDSYSAYFVDNLINKYIDMVSSYLATTDMSIEEILDSTEEILNKETTVEVADGKSVDAQAISASVVNFSGYIIMCVTILIVGVTIGSFNAKDMKARMKIAPVSPRKIAIAQIICNLLLVFALVTVNFVVTLITVHKLMLSLNGLIMYANMLVCGIVALSIAFLVANLISSPNGRNAAANTIALGGSFVTGIFVPMEMLDEGVKTIGSFIPTYWFVKVNNKVSLMTDINFEALKEVFGWMGIQLLFAIAILIVGLAVVKKK